MYFFLYVVENVHADQDIAVYPSPRSKLAMYSV